MPISLALTILILHLIHQYTKHSCESINFKNRAEDRNRRPDHHIRGTDPKRVRWVTRDLATVNDVNHSGERGSGAVCPPLAPDGTKDENWRRRESNPRIRSLAGGNCDEGLDGVGDVSSPFKQKADISRHVVLRTHQGIGDHGQRFGPGMDFGRESPADATR